MRTFKYIGDKDQITPFDMVFPKDTGVDVEDEAVIRKLEGNNHFEEVKRRTRKPKPEAEPVAEEAEPEAETE